MEPMLVTRPLMPSLNELVRRLGDIWATGWLTNGGPQEQELERRLRAYLGVPHLALLANGTTGLLLACRALELSGEVITTPFTFPATVHALEWMGLEPVFCDVDPQTLNLDPARLTSLLTPHTSAILAVHVYGTPCDVEGIGRITERHGLRVIYDAAHAFGVTVGEKGIGTCGDATVFSFHATKLFHTAEGGAVACGDAALAQRFRLLRNFGIANEEEVLLPGINGKMSELQAALGLVVLDELHAERLARAALAELYRQELGSVPGVVLPAPGASEQFGLQYFVIRVQPPEAACTRDQLQRWLRRFNIYTRKYFHPLCSSTPSYRRLPSAAAEQLPIATAAGREVLCLPFHGGVSSAQARAICELTRRGVSGEAHDC